MYFCMNAFMPIYLASHGRSDLIGDGLLALNLGQLPASLLLLGVAGRIERRAWPYLATGLVALVSIVGIVAMIGVATIVWAALLGFAIAMQLTLALTLPPLLCRPEDVARTAAGTFLLSYGMAMLLSLVCGALWDVSGLPALAFVPLALSAAALVAISAGMWRKHELR
jgi:CP family cyanate transporter-like MFS transporter